MIPAIGNDRKINLKKTKLKTYKFPWGGILTLGAFLFPFCDVEFALPTTYQQVKFISIISEHSAPTTNDVKLLSISTLLVVAGEEFVVLLLEGITTVTVLFCAQDPPLLFAAELTICIGT